MNLIHQGMISMINSTASFSGLGIQMAGKTGTAQQSEIHPDHGLFVGFAPADAPEIAIAVRIANGYSSSYAAEIGRDIVKAKYQLGDISESSPEPLPNLALRSQEIKERCERMGTGGYSKRQSLWYGNLYGFRSFF